ncbi:DUF222 domain-containing protein [Nocardia sp. NPDC005978]|uniref:DUF222 domain-containing protein n=1 Tax=Nocardia sp. NPDC005978 TaxID=3156725 RepID=UPI0033B5F510
MFDSREVEAMGDEELIDALRRAHGAAAFAHAAEVTAVREVYRRHRAENAAPGPGGTRAGEFAAAEIAVAVQVSEGVAAALIDIGLALDSLPQTKLAFAAGRIDLSRVQVIVESMRGLTREVREVLEPRLIDTAIRSDPARLRQTARRWLIRLDPDGERRRREAREEDRDIRIRAVEDGMAVFDGLLPAAGAQTLAMRLREMSLQVCDHDPRSMPQRRSDALVALAEGSTQLGCRCGRGKACPAAVAPVSTRRPLVQVGVSADTLLGLRDDPAFLAGYGPIDPALARTLAEHARFQVIPEYFPDEPQPEPEREEESTQAEQPDEPAAADPVQQQRKSTMNTAAVRVEIEVPRPVVNDTTLRPGQVHPSSRRPQTEAALWAKANRERLSARPIDDWSRPERLNPHAPAARADEPKPAESPDSPPVVAYSVDRGNLVPRVQLRPFIAAPPREVRAVDGHCRFPGCTMPAAETIVAQFKPARALRAVPSDPAARSVLCSHHCRLKLLADSGKQPWRVYLSDTDHMRWIDPSGESHETIREGARYLFPHTDLDAPTWPNALRRPHTDLPIPRPFPVDLAYPLESHPLIHAQLSRCTPENDIPEPATRTGTH